MILPEIIIKTFIKLLILHPEFKDLNFENKDLVDSFIKENKVLYESELNKYLDNKNQKSKKSNGDISKDENDEDEELNIKRAKSLQAAFQKWANEEIASLSILHDNVQIIQYNTLLKAVEKVKNTENALISDVFEDIAKLINSKTQETVGIITINISSILQEYAGKNINKFRIFFIKNLSKYRNDARNIFYEELKKINMLAIIKSGISEVDAKISGDKKEQLQKETLAKLQEEINLLNNKLTSHMSINDKSYLVDKNALIENISKDIQNTNNPISYYVFDSCYETLKNISSDYIIYNKCVKLILAQLNKILINFPVIFDKLYDENFTKITTFSLYIFATNIISNGINFSAENLKGAFVAWGNEQWLETKDKLKLSANTEIVLATLKTKLSNIFKSEFPFTTSIGDIILSIFTPIKEARIKWTHCSDLLFNIKLQENLQSSFLKFLKNEDTSNLQIISSYLEHILPSLEMIIQAIMESVYRPVLAKPKKLSNNVLVFKVPAPHYNSYFIVEITLKNNIVYTPIGLENKITEFQFPIIESIKVGNYNGYSIPAGHKITEPELLKIFAPNMTSTNATCNYEHKFLIQSTETYNYNHQEVKSGMQPLGSVILQHYSKGVEKLLDLPIIDLVAPESIAYIGKGAEKLNNLIYDPHVKVTEKTKRDDLKMYFTLSSTYQTQGGMYDPSAKMKLEVTIDYVSIGNKAYNFTLSSLLYKEDISLE